MGVAKRCSFGGKCETDNNTDVGFNKTGTHNATSGSGNSYDKISSARARARRSDTCKLVNGSDAVGI